MRRLRVPAAVLGLVALGTAGYALGAGAAVSLTGTGPEPKTVTIGWGDTVVYSNSDSAEHAIRIPRAEVTTPAIPPGGSFEQVFDKRGGNYNFVQVGRRNYSGQVVVKVEGEVTLKGSAPVVPYGKFVTLSGQSAYPGQPVIVRGRDAGADGEWKAVLEVEAAADGTFSGRVRPKVGARYQARAAADQLASKMVDVAVRPVVTIKVSRRVAPAGSKLVVTGRILPGGAVDRADLLAYDARRKRWGALTTRPVAANGKVVFGVTVEEGSTRLRIAFRRGSTAAGYTPAESRFVRVVGTKPKEN
jgi:plastocyanin